MWNHKNERIFKLWQRGLTVKQIARKIGMPDNITRVVEGLEYKGIYPFVDDHIYKDKRKGPRW